MSELALKLRTDAAVLAAAVPGTAPAGIDISYDPDFEVVRVEMDKLISMSGELPNWSEIIRQGERLLQERSKDMRLIVWVAASRMKRDGLAGFAAGLATMQAVCQEHWAAMFPPINRAKARGNLAGWLGDLMLAEFAEYVPTVRDKDAFDAVETLFNEVDALLSEKLADKYQGMGPIRSLIRDKKRMVPESATAKAPAPAAPVAVSGASIPTAPSGAPQSTVAAPQPAAPAAPPISAITGAGDVLPALRTMGKGIVDAARHIRLAEPSSAWAFRLNRLGSWLAVKQPPPSDGGRTKIAPPQAADIARLVGLMEGQQWSELVNQAEGMLSRFVFWLDLHRMVATALERQGGNFLDVRKAVVGELFTFLHAHPQVLLLGFADGTPFADEATKSWIEEEQAKLGGGAGGSAGVSTQLDEEEIELKKRFEEARALVGSGKIGEGLGLAIQLSRRAADARAQFRARLETSQMALKASKPDLARPILEGLVVEAEEHRLEHWEPELCSQLYVALLKARLGKPGVRVENGPSNDAIFDRLCRLDPAAAMKAGGQ